MDGASQLVGFIEGCEFKGGFKERFSAFIFERGLIGDAMALALGRDRKAGFRASWALEDLYFRRFDAFAPYLGRFASDFPSVENSSARREYGKIMADVIRRKRMPLSAADKDRIAAAACGWLCDEKEAVAVKVWALEILDLLKGDLAWVREELPGILDSLRDHPMAGMQNRVKKMIRNSK